VALTAILPFPADPPPPGARQPAGEIILRVGRGLREIAGDRAIRLVSLVEATLYAGVGTLQAFLPLYLLRVHVSVSEIGLIFGAQGAASILSRIVLGAAADRFGRRRFIVAGGVVCAAVLVTIPHVRAFAPLILLGALFGAGTGTVTPSTTAMIGDLVKHGGFGAAMGGFGTLWDIGHATGPIVAGVLIAWLGYRIAFGLVAGAILTALLVFTAGTAGTPRAARAG